MRGFKITSKTSSALVMTDWPGRGWLNCWAVVTQVGLSTSKAITTPLSVTRWCANSGSSWITRGPTWSLICIVTNLRDLWTRRRAASKTLSSKFTTQRITTGSLKKVCSNSCQFWLQKSQALKSVMNCYRFISMRVICSWISLLMTFVRSRIL